MSRPELIERLRDATPPAPASLRAQVRALEEAPRRRARRGSLRGRTLVALGCASVAAAALVAVALLPGSNAPVSPESRSLITHSVPYGFAAGFGSSSAGEQTAPRTTGSAALNVLPAPSTARAQRYGATLQLRMRDGAAVAAATRRAVAIADALGGFPQSVHVSVTAAAGSAQIALRVPRGRVTTAVARISAIGTVVGEELAVTDLQTGVDTIGLRIEHLERSLAAALRAPKTPQTTKLVAALTAQILGLQRARAATLRSAADATVSVDLATPPRPKPPARHRGRGPFDRLGVVFRDAGIGAVYLLAVGTPLAALVAAGFFAVSRLRRRRDERLLSRS